MPNETPITVLKGLGIFFLISGALVAAFFLVNALSAFSSVDPLVTVTGSRAVGVVDLIVAGGAILSGLLMWALCVVTGIIAEGILANGARLDQIALHLEDIEAGEQNAHLAEVLT